MTLDDLYRLMRSGHVQAQGVVDTLEDPLLVLDGGLNVSAVNPAFLRAFGIERDAIMGENLLQIGEGVWNTPELRHLIAAVIPKTQAILDYEVTADVAPQGPRTFLLSARRLVHPDGAGTSLLLIFSDVTETNRLSAAKDILLAESQHRMRNLLGIVRGLVNQTTTAGVSAETFKDTVLGRLAVLGAAQELARDHAGSVGFRALVERSLAPFLGQVRIAPAPDLEVCETQVTPLGLVLHELSTNAAKYGALSTPDGSVTLGWDVATAGSTPRLTLEWQESGGPAVTPPTQAGFGARLIDGSLQSHLGGRGERRHAPEGLQIRIEVPLV